MRTVLAVSVIVKVSLTTLCADAPNVAPRIVELLEQHHSDIDVSDSFAPIFAHGSLLDSSRGFHLTLLGDHFETVHSLLSQLEGPPSFEKLDPTTNGREARFRSCALVFSPDRSETIVFGFGRKLPPQADPPVPDSPASPIQTFSPVFPYDLKKRSTEGSATIGFVVDFDGTIVNPYVVEASDEQFGVAALAALQRWIFAPAFRSNRPIPSRLEQRFVFRIEDDLAKEEEPNRALQTTPVPRSEN